MDQQLGSVSPCWGTRCGVRESQAPREEKVWLNPLRHPVLLLSLDLPQKQDWVGGAGKERTALQKKPLWHWGQLIK